MEHPNERGEWLEALFRSIDARDADSFVNFMTPDCVYRFGSAAPLEGRAAVREATEQFFTTIGGLRHELHRTWDEGNSVVCEGSVTYCRHDGSELTLPFCNVFVLRDGLIRRYSIYADITPLYAGPE